MSAYIVANCRITDPQRVAGHPDAAVPTVPAHGGEFVVAGGESVPIDGGPGHDTAVIRFPDKDSARAWLDAPEHPAIAPLRQEASEGIIVLMDGTPAEAGVRDE